MTVVIAVAWLFSLFSAYAWARARGHALCAETIRKMIEDSEKGEA